MLHRVTSSSQNTLAKKTNERQRESTLRGNPADIGVAARARTHETPAAGDVPIGERLELAIAHPGDDTTLGFMILAFGGRALFLLAQLLVLRARLGHAPRSRPLALAALAILALATAPLTLIAGTAASSAVLVTVAIADTVRGANTR